MSTNTRIEVAKKSEVERIADIHATCWSEVYDFMPPEVIASRNKNYRLEQWKTWFKQPSEGSAVFSLLNGQDVIGFAVAKKNNDPEIDALGEFHACYILPEFRGGASGPAAMKALALHLKGCGLWPACVWAFKDNPYRRIYPALGCIASVFRDRFIEGIAIPEIGYRVEDFDALMRRLNTMIASAARREMK